MENCLLLWFEDEIIGLFTVRMELKHCCVITLVCSTKETNASLTGVVRGVKSEDGGGGEEEGEARRIETVVSTSFHRADRAVSVEGLGRLVSLLFCSVNRYIFLSLYVW